MTGSESPSRDGRIVTFYSYKGGTGRTMALANTAWILAAAGRRVLMIDWDLEAPGLHLFFHPFLDPDRLKAKSGIVNIIDAYCDEVVRRKAEEGLPPAPEAWWAERNHVADNAVPVTWRFDGGGTLDFISAARTRPVFSPGLTHVDWDLLYDEQKGTKFFAEMRRQLKKTYDYVLIDSRTGQSDIETICTKTLPDDLVVCFTLSNQNIEGAVGLAKLVDEIGGANKLRERVRILPVVARVEDAESDRRDVGLAVARARFAQFVREIEPNDPMRYWNAAQIPYKSRYAFEELLAVFEDTPGDPLSLLSACERVVGLITDGDVTALAPMSETLRKRHRESYARRRPAEPSDVYISSLEADDGWVVWLRRLLRAAGFEVATGAATAAPGRAMGPEAAERMMAADRTVAVVSEAYQGSMLARSVSEEHEQLDPTRADRLVALRVDEAVPAVALAWPHTVDVVGRTEVEVAQALLQALGSTVSAEQVLADAREGAKSDGEAMRYPRSKPAIWNLPNRIATFTGREEDLRKVRRQLASRSITAMHGLGGVGKTFLALEFAHRAQHDYDVVWWIQAERRNIANEDLAALGAAMGIRVGDNIYTAAEATREALRTGEPYARWLLVFDNAVEPDVLQKLMPATTTGHVVITSSDAASAARFNPLEVDVFTREESIEFITGRVPHLSEHDAGLVAAELGDLPLAVELAAAWLGETGMSAEEYIALLPTALEAMMEGARKSAYQRSVVSTWRVAIERIRSESPAAARLLQLFAFFGPDPIALDLVYSDAMIEALLPFDSRLRAGKATIARYIQDLGRYSLVRVHHGGIKAIQVHRLIQQLIRDDVADAAEQRELRRLVHSVLVAARPAQGDVDNPATWDTYATIWPHMPMSEVKNGNADARQLNVDRVRYLRIRGELASAKELAEEMIAAWEADPAIGPDDARNLSMRFELACALRALGDFGRSLDIDSDVLRRQRAHPELGPDHIATLITAGGLGGDYRALGHFDKALALDEQTHASFLALFGSDFPRTLLAASNLAVSLRAVGRPFEARDIDQRTYAARLDVLGAGHTLTLNSAINLARDLRDCGDRTGSLDLLQKTYDQALVRLYAGHPTAVEAAKALAISYRKAGRYEESAELIAGLRAVLGPPEDVTSAPHFGYALNAAAHLSASGDAQGAWELACSVQAKYESAGAADHPDALVCANNESIYLRQLKRPQEARAVAQRAFDGLTGKLGDVHLFTLGCAINLANAVAETGDPAGAETIYRTTIERLHALLAPGQSRERLTHPDLLACQANLAVTWHETGRTVEAEEERSRIADLLARTRGRTHPNTVALSQWLRVGRELDATPL